MLGILGIILGIMWCYVMVFSVVVNYIGTNARAIHNNVLLTHKML